MASMGNDYYYVTPTGPVFAGQGMNLHGTSQGGGVSASFQHATLAPVDGSNDDFDYACAEINVENDHPVLQQWAPQVPDFNTSNYGFSDTELTETDSSMAEMPDDIPPSLFTTDYCERSDTPYDLLQDEQNPGAAWVEGPPEGASFGHFSGSNMFDFNGILPGTSNSETGLDFPQYQSSVEASTESEPEVLQMPTRAQRAERRAQLLAEMQQISRELLDLEALDAA